MCMENLGSNASNVGPGGTAPFVPGGSQDPNNAGLPSLAQPPKKQGGFNSLSLLFPGLSSAGRSLMFPLLSRIPGLSRLFQ